MKDKTQSLHLVEMVQQHKVYPAYELVLPLFLVRRKSAKKLVKGDVLLMGDESLNLKLLKDCETFGDVKIEESENSCKIKIINIHKSTFEAYNSKKYEEIKCSFSFLQSRIFEVGHKIDISSVNLKKVTLFVDNNKIAEGTLINVEDEIAIKITKVNL